MHPDRPASALLGIGTANFIAAYGLQPAAAPPGAALVLSAMDRGVNYIDTAAAYGDAEQVLGGIAGAIAARGARVATKVAVAPASGADAVLGDVQASLSRLRMPRVDTLLLHSAGADVLNAAAIEDACNVMRERGWAARTGASTYGAKDAAAALEKPWCGAVQFEYSLLNTSVLPAARAARRQGQELIARSVLCKGLLTNSWREAPALAAPLVPMLTALEARAAAWGYSLPGLAIRFALDTAGLDVVLVGVGSDSELDAALQARDGARLSPAQLGELAAFDASAQDAAHPERWNHVQTT